MVPCSLPLSSSSFHKQDTSQRSECQIIAFDRQNEKVRITVYHPVPKIDIYVYTRRHEDGEHKTVTKQWNTILKPQPRRFHLIILQNIVAKSAFSTTVCIYIKTY